MELTPSIDTDRNELNPINKSGERNFYCPNYVYCLDMAASNWWSHFSCEECPHKDIDGSPDIEEFAYETVGWDDIWSES